MRLSSCLIPVTLAVLLSGCANSSLVDNVATSKKRLDPWLPPLPVPVPSFRANDWAMESAPQRAPAAPRAQAAPAPAPVAPAAPAVASAVAYESVKWMRQASGCESGQNCAEVSVDYPRFAQDKALTETIERQLGAMLTGLTQPQLMQPVVNSASYSVESSVERYLSDSYSEGFVELSSNVVRVDDQVAVLSTNGTLHRVAHDVSETQYLLFDRAQQRLIDPRELAQSEGLSRHVAELLHSGAQSDASTRAADALLTAAGS